jgi:hypothetical protein
MLARGRFPRQENSMKFLSVTLAAFLLAGYVQAQTASQSQTPAPAPATQPAGSSHHSDSLGKACKKEVHKLCGHAHGQEMKDCIKSGMDMNKFSADCQSKLSAKAAAGK